jgi:hypothetical protein
MPNASPKTLANKLVGHLLANPQALQDFKQLPDSAQQPGAKTAGGVARLIRKHLGVDVDADFVRSMNPHIKNAAANVSQSGAGKAVRTIFGSMGCVI